MNDKKRIKYINNAELKFQKQQIQAAIAMERLQNALKVVDEHREELTADAYADVMKKLSEQREEIKKFIMGAKEKYALKLKELGDPTIDLNEEEQ